MNNKILITDVDGVFTDGGFYYTEEGKVMKKFGPHDADGIKMIREMGIEVIAITADKRGYPITMKRMNDMNIPLFVVSESGRLPFVKAYGFERVIFVGDGYHDAPVLEKAWMGIAPANAVEHALESADYVCEAEGGQGVFLEIALKMKEKNETDIKRT